MNGRQKCDKTSMVKCRLLELDISVVSVNIFFKFAIYVFEILHGKMI